MVGVQMRVDRLHELEIELLHQLEVAVDLLEHGIDDEGFAAATACEDIAIGARDAVEQLPEDHPGLPVAQPETSCLQLALIVILQPVWKRPRQPSLLQGHEGSPDHGGAELVLAVRRPAVDRPGDKKVVLRPIGEDRPEAEGLAFIKPIGAAQFLSIEAAKAKAEADGIIGVASGRALPVLFETSVVISPSWRAGSARLSKSARIHEPRSRGFEMMAPAAPAQDQFLRPHILADQRRERRYVTRLRLVREAVLEQEERARQRASTGSAAAGPGCGPLA